MLVRATVPSITRQVVQAGLLKNLYFHRGGFSWRSFSTMAGPTQQIIEKKLTEALEPADLHVINESYMHAVPKNSETHFKVVVVSSKFEGLKLLARHRLVNQVLAEELAAGIHALSITAKTPEEGSGRISPSPKCMGGGRH